jgi:putative inorganic carbon (HCO3(-)) transporter
MFIITWFLQLGGRKEFLAAIRFELCLGVLLVVVSCFFLPIQHSDQSQKSVTRPLWFFIACLVWGMIISKDLDISIVIFWDRIVKFACMGLFMVAFVQGPKQLKWVLGALLLAWLKIEQEGIVGIITGGQVWQDQGVMRLHGSTGLYGHPNSLAGLALGSLPFIYFLFPLLPNIGRVLLLIQAVAAVIVTVYTGSRTGYIGLAFFVSYVVYGVKSKAKVIALMMLTVVIIGPVVPQEYWLRFQTIFTGQEIEGQSTGKRKEIIEDAIAIFAMHPLGVGIGSFPSVRDAYFGRKQDTHNLYLEVATNLGVHGLIAFLVFIYAILRCLRQTFRSTSTQILDLSQATQQCRSEDTYEIHVKDLQLIKATAQAAYVYVLVRLVLGFFGHDLYEIYWWLALGLALALLNMNVIAQEKTKKLLLVAGRRGDE